MNSTTIFRLATATVPTLALSSSKIKYLNTNSIILSHNILHTVRPSSQCGVSRLFYVGHSSLIICNMAVMGMDMGDGGVRV
ncbi:hypothetical protein FRC08_013775 [Ceratobasidium sp. 394]|nr:hypothetical protein FRC08_013775 [Ceratobasidium sp. 394]